MEGPPRQLMHQSPPVCPGILRVTCLFIIWLDVIVKTLNIFVYFFYQAEIWFKRNPSVWAGVLKEKCSWWWCSQFSSEYKHAASVWFYSEPALIVAFLILPLLCFSHQLSVQIIAPGRIRQLWTPPPHSFTPQEWKVLITVHWLSCCMITNRPTILKICCFLFLSGRCHWQFWAGCQSQFSGVMLGISDESREKRQPSHRYQPPQQTQGLLF